MFTDPMADYFARLSYGDLPTDVRERMKLALLDTLGVMLAGVAYARDHHDDKVRCYVQGLGDRAEATVVGENLKSSTRAAAFANGCMIELLDWQDTVMVARLHCSSGVVPAALAAAEYHHKSGQDLLTALVVGYEVSSRVGVAMQPSHWRKGFQGTGTINTVGSAAAVGRLLGLDPAGMANAIGIAGHILPISNGDGVFGGYSIKVVHGGQAALAALEAAALAQLGFTAGPIEGVAPRNHALLTITSDQANPEELVSGLGEHWYVRSISYKPYPTGLLMVGPVESAILLAQQHDLRPELIERIDLRTFSDAAYFVGRYTNTESTVSACQLSMPYCVAAALSDRAVGPEQFAENRIADPAVHALAARVKLSADPEMDKNFPAQMAHDIAITLRDGRRVDRQLSDIWGSPARPMTANDLAAKFLGQAQKVLGPARAKAVKQMVLDLEQLDSVAELGELLR